MEEINSANSCYVHVHVQVKGHVQRKPDIFFANVYHEASALKQRLGCDNAFRKWEFCRSG